MDLGVRAFGGIDVDDREDFLGRVVLHCGANGARRSGGGETEAADGVGLAAFLAKHEREDLLGAVA